MVDKKNNQKDARFLKDGRLFTICESCGKKLSGLSNNDVAEHLIFCYYVNR